MMQGKAGGGHIAWIRSKKEAFVIDISKPERITLAHGPEMCTKVTRQPPQTEPSPSGRTPSLCLTAWCNVAPESRKTSASSHSIATQTLYIQVYLGVEQELAEE